MQPGMLRQLAADRIRELVTVAGGARQASAARRAWRRDRGLAAR